MSNSTKPIDSKAKERYAELIGLGLSHREAAGATGISERSGERLMVAPQYRKIAEETKKRGRGEEGALGRVIRELSKPTTRTATRTTHSATKARSWCTGTRTRSRLKLRVM